MVGYILCTAEPVCAKTLNFVFTKVSVSTPFLGVSIPAENYQPSTPLVHAFRSILPQATHPALNPWRMFELLTEW